LAREVVLVVEDSQAAYEQVRDAAARLGLATEWALNGAEALRLCRLRSFAAIVLDLYLPLLDGISFLRIRRSEKRHEAPVVVISATARQDEIDRAFGLGAIAFLQKPLDPERLDEALRRIVAPGPAASG